jgi:hypothetical protein
MPEITITFTDDAKDQLITTVLDAEETQALIAIAKDERRDPTAQASVLLADSMGLWYPPTDAKNEPKAGTTPTPRKRNRARPKAVKATGTFGPGGTER